MIEKKLLEIELSKIFKIIFQSIDKNTWIDVGQSKLYQESFLDDFQFILENVKKEDNILEIGCGRGILSALLSTVGYKNIDAIDVKYTETNPIGTKIYNGKIDNNTMLANRGVIWSKLMEQYNVHYSFYSGEKINQPENKYDVVILYAVVEHVEKRFMDSFWNEINRVLKNDGIILFFKLPRKFSLNENLANLLRISHHENLYTKKKFSDLIKKYNLKLIKIESTDLFPRFVGKKLQVYYNYNKPFFFILFIERIIIFLRFNFLNHHFRGIIKKPT